MKDISLLQKVSLFSHPDQRQLKSIRKACTERVFAAGEMLVEQGNPGIGLFIIAEGRVKIIKILRDGQKVDLAVKGSGEVIGEMSVIDGSLRTASVQALEPTSCLILSAWSFKSLMERRPEVALGILPIIMQRFHETSEALQTLSNHQHDETPGTTEPISTPGIASPLT